MSKKGFQKDLYKNVFFLYVNTKTLWKISYFTPSLCILTGKVIDGKLIEVWSYF